MATSAMNGIIGFGPQAAKGTVATTFYRHRATNVDLDLVDDIREGPPEVGGIATPTFPYKGGPVVAGGFTIMPRLENSIGWLLYAMMGEVDTDVDYDDIYNHVFKMKADDSIYHPWVSYRKFIPANPDIPNSELRQEFLDCKVVGSVFTLPNDGPIAARIDNIGRRMDIPPDPFVWENDFESWESIPVACVTDGFIKLDGDELPVVSCQLGWQNVPLDLRQERVFGDPYLDTVTTIQRRLTFDLVAKWKDPDLYRQILGGSNVATEWGPHPFTAPLSVKVAASTDLTGHATPASLQIDAAEVMLTQVGGITLAGNQAIMTRFSGVALANVGEYATFTLRNLATGYVWPA